MVENWMWTSTKFWSFPLFCSAEVCSHWPRSCVWSHVAVFPDGGEMISTTVWAFAALSWASVDKLTVIYWWDSAQHCQRWQRTCCWGRKVRTVCPPVDALRWKSCLWWFFFKKRVNMQNLISIMSAGAHSIFTDKCPSDPSGVEC